MIFNDFKDIKKDIHDKISLHMEDNDTINTKHIVSLLKSYLYELQILKEIDGYQTNINNENSNILFVEITKDDNINSFMVNINTELRRLKIKKINNKSEYIFYSE